MKILHIGKSGNVERFTANSQWKERTELIEMPAGINYEEYLSQAKHAEVIIADAMAKIPEELIFGMPDLKMIHSEGVGFNFIDTKAAAQNKVYVCNCKGMNAMAVAEQTILLMLSMLRDVRLSDEAVRTGHQIEKKDEYMQKGNLMELSDCVVGLVGFGDISRCVAHLLKAFGTKTYYYNRTRVDRSIEEEYQVSYLELTELLQKSNMCSIHLPASEETHHIVNDLFLDKLPQGSYLVNTSRGELIDGMAMVRALKSGRLKMAALDTIEGEPVQLNNFLLNQEKDIMERLIFSPHIGGITSSSFKRGYSMIWSNINKIAAGERPDRIVNSL